MRTEETCSMATEQEDDEVKDDYADVRVDVVKETPWLPDKKGAGQLNDEQIATRCLEQRMIEPFLTKSVRQHGTSAGPTHHGYDARLGNTFKTFRKPIRRNRSWCTTLDKLGTEVIGECSAFQDPDFTAAQLDGIMRDLIIPGVTKLTDDDFIIDVIENPEDGYVLWPMTGVLAGTLEYFRIPEDICGYVEGKSTLARLFVHPMCTPLEAGWEGEVTLEIVNLGARPVVLRPGMGVVQTTFQAVDRPTITYGEKPNFYQGQKGVRVSTW